MENELKSLLQKTLNEHGTIKFDVSYVTKGCDIEIEIGDKRNEECGPFYDQLSEWLGYEEFIDYLIDHGVQHNFNGEIFLENGEICFNLTLKGYCYEYDDLDRGYVEFGEDFITNVLKIDLSIFGKNDSFDEENLYVHFNKMKDAPIERLELSYYNEEWHDIQLNETQLEILNKFIESEIDQAIPSIYIDFDCEILWEVECDEKYLEFNYRSTPIKLKLNDILA